MNQVMSSNYWPLCRRSCSAVDNFVLFYFRSCPLLLLIGAPIYEVTFNRIHISNFLYFEELYEVTTLIFLASRAARPRLSSFSSYCIQKWFVSKECFFCYLYIQMFHGILKFYEFSYSQNFKKFIFCRI